MARQVARAQQLPSPPVEGSLTRMVGLALEASGCQAAVGDVCDLLNGDGSRVEAEVVGFAGDKLFLMPTSEVHGLAPAARVVPRQRAGSVHVGPGLLGRVIDGNGIPLDGLGPIQADERVKLLGQTINPLARHPIDTPLDVGVRSINSLLTVGRGQRIGLFAGSGVGKSVLLGMMARYTSADVIVVGLIGERGREVKEFVERILGPDGRRRSVVVASSGRQSAADPPAWRVAGHVHRRILPRARAIRAADHGFVDAVCAGAARDRPRHRRGAGHQAAIRRRCSRACRRWWNAPATAPRARARSRRSTRC